MHNTATMPVQVTVSVFLIKRLDVELQVVLRSTGLVKIEPYRCKEENMRLWSGIAQTQSILAQSQLERHKGVQQLDMLHALFQHSGWDVKGLEEHKEFSL